MRNRGFLIFCLLLTCSGCCIRLLFFTGGGDKIIKSYALKTNTKNETNNAIKCLFINHNEYKVPDSVKPHLLIHNYSDLSTLKSQEWNADSINFHFYVKKENKEYLFWTRFRGLADNWDVTQYEYGTACIISIKGITELNNHEYKKRVAIKLFETEILPKIQEYLTKGGCD